MRVLHSSLLLLLFPLIVQSQSNVGRWSFGVHGGINNFVNDYNTRMIGAGTELTLRYGVTRSFSLGIRTGYEDLKARQKPPLSILPSDYVKLHAFASSITGWIHLAPGKPFAPYLYLGGGTLLYTREAGEGEPLPDDKVKTSILIPAGLGFESHLSRSVSVGVEMGVRLGDDKLDAYRYKKNDSYLTAKVGVNFFFGRSPFDDDDKDGLNNAEELRLGMDPNKPDTDGDGLGDGEEVTRFLTNPLLSDTDGDGLSDGEEVHKYKTAPTKRDTDGDWLSDGDEVLKHGTDPLRIDTEGDGLPDGDEVLKHNTNPLKVDTDGDGLSHWDEVIVFKSNPNERDTDGDGLPEGDEVFRYKTDPTNPDTDGGGTDDGTEIGPGTNPLDPKDDGFARGIVLERGKSVVLKGVTFRSGSAQLTRESEEVLELAFRALSANPDIAVEIAGHTDNIGSVETNNDLSRLRADAVKAWLVKRGIHPGRLRTVGWGMRYPIAPNETPEGRSRNRRIEFNVLK